MKHSIKIRQKKTGFTLIELVMVIVILGILAAVALPKFVDLSQDAKTARAKALAGSISSGSLANYAKIKADPAGTTWPADFKIFRAGQGTVSLDEDVTRIMEGWSDSGDPRGELSLEDPGACDNDHASVPVLDIKTGQTLALAEVYCAN